MKPKAILLGLGCFILISSPLYLALAFQWSIGEQIVKIYWWLQYGAFIISGALTAYLSRQNELLNSISLGIGIVIFLGIFNYMWSANGLPSDLGGLAGSFWVAVLSLPGAVILASASAIVIGLWRKQYKAYKRQRQN